MNVTGSSSLGQRDGDRCRRAASVLALAPGLSQRRRIGVEATMPASRRLAGSPGHSRGPEPDVREQGTHWSVHSLNSAEKQALVDAHSRLLGPSSAWPLVRSVSLARMTVEARAGWSPHREMTLSAQLHLVEATDSSLGTVSGSGCASFMGRVPSRLPAVHERSSCRVTGLDLRLSCLCSSRLAARCARRRFRDRRYAPTHRRDVVRQTGLRTTTSTIQRPAAASDCPSNETPSGRTWARNVRPLTESRTSQ
jgi:hypothetical protein